MSDSKQIVPNQAANVLPSCLSASRRASNASATRSSAIKLWSRPPDFASNAWRETRPRKRPQRVRQIQSAPGRLGPRLRARTL